MTTKIQKRKEIESKELLLKLQLSRVLVELEKLREKKERLCADIDHLYVKKMSLGFNHNSI